MAVIVDEITVTAMAAAKFETGFLARIPIRLVEDPANPGIMMPEFATAKEHLRADIIRRYLRIADQGLKLIAGATAEKMDEGDLT